MCNQKVAVHPYFKTPVFQEHMHILGIVCTTHPAMGQRSHGVTDDFGNLVELNSGAVITYMYN